MMPRRRRVSLALSEWPPLDQAAWRAAMRAGDVLEDGGLAATWRPATRVGAENAYGRFLHWHASHRPVELHQGPADRVRPETVLPYIEHLCAIGAISSAVAYISFLVLAMRAMAPDRDWQWLQHLARRLKRRAKPVRDKRAHLQAVADLVSLGLRIMAEATVTGEITDWRQATDYRDGLMIALNALCPLRRRTFIGIIIDRHLLRRGDGYWLACDGKDTKTDNVIEMPFPGVLLPHLDHYLQVVRPWLCRQTANRDPRFPFRAAGSRLWVSKTGSAYAPETYYAMIRTRTGVAFDNRIWPHLFRDCAASDIATNHPEYIGIVQSVLGQSGMKTAEAHYIHAQTVVAARKHHALVTSIRRRAGTGRRGRGGKLAKPEF